MDNREKKIQEGLKKDIYRQVEQLDNLEDVTVSSTEKLANILDGYLTKIDEESLEEFKDQFEIVDSQNIEIEVDDKDLLKKYNDQLHDNNLETLDNLLASNNLVQDTDVEDFTQNIPDLKEETTSYQIDESKISKTEFFSDEIKLDDLENDSTIEKEAEVVVEEKNKKGNIIDIILTIIVIILTLLLLYSIFGG